MPAQVLTFANLQDLFSGVTADITGLSRSSGQIRIAYQANSQPGWDITQDIIAINVTQVDNYYDKQRDITYVNNDPNDAEQQITYTRVMQVVWSIYGPNAFDLADTVRNGILTEAAHNTLTTNFVYPVATIPAPMRIPYLFNGQWWERSDVTATFYVWTKRVNVVPYLEYADIQILDDNGLERTVHLAVRNSLDFGLGGNSQYWFLMFLI